MSLRLWNFRCNKCGHAYEGEPITAAKIPKTIKCRQEGCKGRASWALGGRVNGIHTTHSGRKYGEFDPQFGCVVEDYHHKKRLLREQGLAELPPETLEQVEEARYEGVRSQMGQSRGDTIVADSEEELMAKIAPEDRQRGMQESWLSF